MVVEVSKDFLLNNQFIERGELVLERLLSHVPRETLELLGRYVNLLFQWNAKTNLTGSANPEDFYIHHLLDVCCAQLALEKNFYKLESADSQLAIHGEDEIILKNENKLKNGVWLDVGSGGGIPGIPWAILWPQTRFGLVEVRQKKAAFLDRAISLLFLKNTKVFPCLIERLDLNLKKDWGNILVPPSDSIHQEEMGGEADSLYVVSRGTADPRGLLRLAHGAPFFWKYWFVFSSEKTQEQFHRDSLEFALKAEVFCYERAYEPYVSQQGTGLMTVLSRLPSSK